MCVTKYVLLQFNLFICAYTRTMYDADPQEDYLLGAASESSEPEHN